MLGAIVIIVVESPPPSDPVGTALDTFGSIELGSGGAFTTSTASHGLEAGGPWNPGTWIDIAQPSLPETRRKHRVSYVDTGKGFALYRINLRFEGDRKRVPVSVSDVAIELAEAPAVAAGPARRVIRLRHEPDAPGDGADSIYRYDREALLNALKQARMGERA